GLRGRASPAARLPPAAPAGAPARPLGDGGRGARGGPLRGPRWPPVRGHRHGGAGRWPRRDPSGGYRHRGGRPRLPSGGYPRRHPNQDADRAGVVRRACDRARRADRGRGWRRDRRRQRTPPRPHDARGARGPAPAGRRPARAARGRGRSARDRRRSARRGPRLGSPGRNPLIRMPEPGARIVKMTVLAAIAAAVLTLAAPPRGHLYRLANGWTFGPGSVSAASPDASGEPGPSASAAPGDGSGGDTRSAGEGPGLVGAPFLAIGG